ncbi:MAG: gliding motility-associated C-terminal domain-containing protein [Bacteroidia bacterium]
MKKILLFASWILIFTLSSKTTEACHGLALVNYSISAGPTGITINGSSDAATCGCGPYYMEAELTCFSTFPANTPSCTDPAWGSYPYYRADLNVPGYGPPNWTEQCALEPYNTLFIPYSDLCQGSTYQIRVRERICGSGGSTGPWMPVFTFTTPGTPPPLVIDSVTAVNQFLCIGDSTQVNVFTTGGCTAGRIYSWSPTTGVSNPNIANPIITPTQTTTYTVTTLDPCSNETDSDTITIFISTPPSAGQILPTLSTNDMILCQGDTMHLTIFGTGSTTFQWQSSTNGVTFTNIPNANDSTVLIGPMATNTQYRVIISSPLGCPAFSSIATVTVVPAPNISITQDTSLCQGQTIQLFASGGTSYSWTPNNGTLSSTTSATPICNTPVSQTYYVTVTNQFGCTASDSVRITINGLPTISASGLLADCGKNNGKIRITGVGGNGTPPYIYSLDGINFQSDTIFTNLAVGAYTVTIEDANGCQAQSSLIGVSEQIITNAAFTANGETTITTGLAPYNVTVLNNSTNATNFVWDFGNGQTGNSPVIGDSKTITYNDFGEYEIILIAYDTEPRCADTVSVKVKVDGKSALIMPNVFSPNGDGINDLFAPIPYDKVNKPDGSRNIIEYNLQIFDRWGKLVFETNDFNTGWDGKRRNGAQANDGVYYWIVKAIGIDNESYTLKGNVTLLR